MGSRFGASFGAVGPVLASEIPFLAPAQASARHPRRVEPSQPFVRMQTAAARAQLVLLWRLPLLSLCRNRHTLPVGNMTAFLWEQTALANEAGLLRPGDAHLARPSTPFRDRGPSRFCFSSSPPLPGPRALPA